MYQQPVLLVETGLSLVTDRRTCLLSLCSCFGVLEVHRVGSTVTQSAVLPPWRILRVPRVCPGPTLPLKPVCGRRQERFWTRRTIGQPQHLQHPEPGLTCSGDQAGRARPAVFPFPGPRFSGLRFFLPSDQLSVRSTNKVGLLEASTIFRAPIPRKRRESLPVAKMPVPGSLESNPSSSSA